MKTITHKTYIAQVTFGLFKGYSNKLISLKEFKESLFFAQQKIKLENDIALSVKLRHCEILCLGQEEPSIELEFIQYPKFPQEESALKNAIVELTKMMMLELEQNRVVIVFSDETIMLEQSDAIDPKIKL
ncbi:hypothetical protein [Flavobacterium sp. ZS1P14]|uniref:hypothetical protein n=1 Tax=Flavobacterium sp. ZS1P14 TaxID=3401729 RepID=UPI003AB0DB0B